MIQRLVIAFAAGLSLASSAAASDPVAGERVFKKCAACHAVGEGAVNKVGPHLNGLFGRTTGTVPDYKYSDANKNSGIVWSVEIFDAYIRAPRVVIPGTKMPFAGLKKDQEVADLIAYLSQFGPDGELVIE